MDIKQRILARPDLQDARIRCELDELTAGLNAQAPLVVQSRFVNMRTIAAECDDADGIITDLIEAAKVSPSVAEMLGFLRSETGMDVGHERTQEQLRKVTTEQRAASLKALALLPVIVTRDQVKDAMFNDDGTEK